MPPDPVGQHARSRARPPFSITLALRFAAGAGVEAEAVRELARGFEHERGHLFLDALRSQPGCRCGDRNRADDVAGVVADGGGDGADLLEVLAEVDGVPAGCDGAEL